MTKPERNYLVIRPLSLIRHSTFRIRHLLMAACTVGPFNSIRFVHRLDVLLITTRGRLKTQFSIVVIDSNTENGTTNRLCGTGHIGDIGAIVNAGLTEEMADAHVAVAGALAP